MPPEQRPTVNLSKDSKKEIVDALRDIRKAIVQEERKTQTFTENIADSLTSGSSFVQSVREAIRTESAKESAKLRRALDPLEIVKRMTGGSKLATTLAGKAIGRSNESIRRSVGLRADEPDNFTPIPQSSLTPPAAEQISSGEAIPLLEQIARSVSLIAIRVTDIADKMKAMQKAELDKNGRLRDKVSGKFMSVQAANEAKRQQELLKEIRDSLMGIRKDEAKRDDQRRDDARVQQAKSNVRKPTVQVTASGQEVTKPAPKDEGGFFSGFLGSFLKLETAIAGFAVALGAIMAPLETFKTGLQFMSKGLDAVKNTFQFFSKGEKVAEAVSAASKVGKAVEGTAIASKAVTAGARIGQKIMGKSATTAAEKAALAESEGAAKALTKGTEAVAESEGAAKALTKGTEAVAEAGAKGAAKVATTPKPTPTPKPPAPPPPPPKKTITKVGKDKLTKILETRLPKAFGGASIGKIIPGIGTALGLGFAISRLVKGDLVGAALEGVSGFGGAVTAVPAIVAQLVRDVYQDAYGVFPEVDPNAGERLPELADTVKESTANWLRGKDKQTVEGPKSADTMSTPGKTLSTPIAEMPQNKTGTTLAQSTQMKQELAGTSAPTPTSASVTVQNVTNNKSSAIFTSGLPSTRSQDSSYLRALDDNIPG